MLGGKNEKNNIFNSRIGNFLLYLGLSDVCCYGFGISICVSRCEFVNMNEFIEYLKMYVVIGIYLLSVLLMILLGILFIYFVVTLSL